MKKFFYLCIVLLCGLSSFAQTLSPSSSTVTSGNTVTITASGESNSGYFTSINADPTLITSSSPNSFGSNWVNFNFVQYVSQYNIASQQPTKFTITVTNSFNAAYTVTLGFRTNIYNFTGGGTTSNVIKYVTLTINPVTAPTTYRNVAKSGTFTRNNCGGGTTGSSVTYNVAANTYSSTTSQAAADQLAINDVNANGQAYANANGQCTQIYYNTVLTSNFTRNTCQVYENSGAAVAYTVPASTYSSTISQADADLKAQADVNANGQAYANANGSCVIKNTLTIALYTSTEYPGAPGSGITRLLVKDSNGSILYDFNQADLIAGKEIPRNSSYTFVVTTTGNTDTWKSLVFGSYIIDNDNGTTYTFSNIDTSNNYYMTIALYNAFA